MRSKGKTAWLSCGTLLWGLFIFSQSLKTGDVSERMSTGIVAWLAQFLQVDEDLLHFLVRKGAHFGEYLVLGVLLCVTLYYAGLFPRRFDCTPLFLGIFWAALDEVIQTFVPDRTGMVTDVLIDLGGVLTGVLLVLLVRKIYIIQKRKKENRECSA